MLVFQPGARSLGVALPISFKYAILDAFRHNYWLLGYGNNINVVMQLWIETASALPYTDGVGESVVNALLRMASSAKLRSHIPAAAWEWLNKRPVLHPSVVMSGSGVSLDVFEQVQELGDVELTTSYLFIVWPEWCWVNLEIRLAMFNFIRTELCGVERVGHCTDLIQRLDDILSRLEPASQESVQNRIQEFKGFRRALIEVKGATVKTLTSSLPRITSWFYLLTYPRLRRISLHFYVCASPSLLIAARWPTLSNLQAFHPRAPLPTHQPL